MIHIQSGIVPPAPVRAGTNAVFALVATLVMLLLGAAVRAGAVPAVAAGTQPIQDTFSPAGRAAFAVWMLLALLATIVAPLVTLVLWRRNALVRQTMLLYAGMLLIQIPTELVAARLFFVNIVVFIGMLYTGFRLCQLAGFRRLLRAQTDFSARSLRVLTALVRFGQLFWAANLALLVFLLVTRVLQF